MSIVAGPQVGFNSNSHGTSARPTTSWCAFIGLQLGILSIRIRMSIGVEHSEVRNRMRSLASVRIRMIIVADPPDQQNSHAFIRLLLAISWNSLVSARGHDDSLNSVGTTKSLKCCLKTTKNMRIEIVDARPCRQIR